MNTRGYTRIARRPVVLGVVAAVLASVCYGVTQFMGRKLVTELAPPLVVTTFGLLAGMVILAALSFRGLVLDRRAPRRAFLHMALAGATASAGVAFMFSALKSAPLTIVAPVVSINPLVSLGLAHLFLQRMERVTLRMWVGAAMVVAGVILVALQAR